MKLVVLGDPVAHSLSPALHRAALASVGLRGSYEARRVDTSGMQHAVGELREGTLDGANVTMPHKQLAATLADRCADVAARAGAVNTLVRVGREVVGHNTDVAGILHAVDARRLPDGPVLVLGAGGAAAAALLAFEGRPIVVSARRTDRAAELVASTGVAADVVPWGTSVPEALLVNATAAGMDGESLPIEDLEVHSGLLDMPYASGATPTATAMRAAGLPVADGPDMLLGQAVAAFRLWTGMQPDEVEMRRAMESAATR
ncbi:MAG: shikimate dehydrogenase [Acidimicrobiia bacterium]|nr:shikimate dehydrogenase [Acidimicrobiia bacterium]